MHFKITYTDQTTTPTNPLFCISLPAEHFSLSFVLFCFFKCSRLQRIIWWVLKNAHWRLRTSELSPECGLSSPPRQSLPPSPGGSCSLISSSTGYFAALELLSRDSQRMSERFGLRHWALWFGDSSLLCVAGFIQAWPINKAQIHPGRQVYSGFIHGSFSCMWPDQSVSAKTQQQRP